ncbi:MAG: hypothetical protein Kow0069_25220 [Promethearchaeota archaeon]
MKEKFTFRFAVNVSTNAMGFLASYLFALKAEVALVGVMGFASSLVGTFASFTSLGVEQVYVQHNDEPEFREYFTTLLAMRGVLIGGWVLPYAAYVLATGDQYRAYMLMVGVADLLVRVTGVFTWHLKARLKVYKADMPLFAFFAAYSVVKVVVALNLDSISRPLDVLAATSIATGACQLFTIAWIGRGEYAFSRFRGKLAGQLLREAKPLIVGNVVGMLVTNLGNVLVDVSFGHEDFAYYYFVNTYVIQVLLGVSGAFTDIYVAHFSRLYQRGEVEQIAAFAKRLERYSSIAFGWVAFVSILTADLVFSLVIPNYLPGLRYLYLLAFVPYLAAVNRPYAKLFYACRRQDVLAKYSVVKVVARMVLTFVIVPTSVFGARALGLGATGLSLLTLGMWTVDFVAQRAFSRRLFGVSSNRGTFLHLGVGFSALSLVAAVRAALQPALGSGVVVLLVTVGLFSCAYFGCLYLLRQINRGDLRFVKELLKPRNYVRDFRQEFGEAPQ